MKVKYLKEQVRCPRCNKKTRKLITYENEEICYCCFVTKANLKFLKESPNYSKHLIKRGLFVPAKSPGKTIYAINGVTSVYRNGCIN